MSGWETANCYDEIVGPNSFLGRETPAEVVLVTRLPPALEQINPDLPPEAIAAAINDFFLASQLWITGDLYTKRPDLIGDVNGLPLVFIELKVSHKRVEDAYHKNLSDYRDTIPPICWHNAFIVLLNGSETVVGSTTATWEHFAAWKKIDDEHEPGVISLETAIRAS